MSTSVYLWVHLQAGLILIGSLCLLARRTAPKRLALLALPVTALALWPPIGLAPALFAYTGLISGPGLALLLDFVLRRLTGFELMPDNQRRLLWAACALLAAFLYPMALGLGGFDPYRLGFTDGYLFVALGLAAALAWGWGLRALAWLSLAVLWVWYLRWGESTNLWDYVLDAWTGLAAIALAASRAFRRSWRLLGRP